MGSILQPGIAGADLRPVTSSLLWCRASSNLRQGNSLQASLHIINDITLQATFRLCCGGPTCSTYENSASSNSSSTSDRPSSAPCQSPANSCCCCSRPGGPPADAAAVRASERPPPLRRTPAAMERNLQTRQSCRIARDIELANHAHVLQGGCHCASRLCQFREGTQHCIIIKPREPAAKRPVSCTA